VSTAFDELLATMRSLRDPESGCPWDLQQTHASLRDSLLEETYELLDALGGSDEAGLVEELGDLLLHVVFHAQIGADEGAFTIDDVITRVNAKLVRRHPHVFADASARTPEEVKGQWEQVKAQERAAQGRAEASMLDGVSTAMPALAYAEAVLGRARQAGFAQTAGIRNVSGGKGTIGEAPRERRPDHDLRYTLTGAGTSMPLARNSVTSGRNDYRVGRTGGPENSRPTI